YSFDTVKIDKSFVDQIENKPSIRAVIESTISMCHNMGLSTVAEGVETVSQLNYLKEHGCDFIQGYYFSRPLSEQDFLAYLSDAQIAEHETFGLSEKNLSRNLDLKNLMDLIDHSGQFIQVCHPEDYSMVYANQMTLDISGHPELPYEGARCYQYMLGYSAPCGHCPMKQMGAEEEKEIEVDDGEHVFALKARYTTWNGRKVFIEYGRDITGTKKAQHRYADQIRRILETIPEGQGVFHVDLTADRWLSSGGNAKNARDMQNISDVNTLIHQIASFVPDSRGQERFFETFCREAQLRAKAEHRHQILLETESYYDDRSIRWSRITAHLIENPETGHTESIIYGVDISKEKTHIEEIERERLEESIEKEKLKHKIDETMELYQQADRDRRYDYLTGLGSRLELHDYLKKAEEQKTDPVTAVMMLDLDNFKHVNDTYGHDAGDQCLKMVGEILIDFGFQHDITFYRFGGEEIVGLFRNTRNDVSGTVSSLLRMIRAQKIVLPDGKEISVTASAGYTAVPDDYHAMITRADHAMYEAKKHGKNQAACLD
ncbi:MAG: diguanylate cyclase domain-containing protein, partial [Bulleidia sp.]